MIREHAVAVEADLASAGFDLRDFWAPGGGVSRLSPRRLLVLLQGVPNPALQRALARDEDEAQKALLSSRRDYYDKKKTEQEVSDG